jgi:hypothetical protein
MVSREWIINNLKEYISVNDINIRHGWFLIKIESVVRATTVEKQSVVMDENKAIIARPYFKAVQDFDNKIINEDEYWSRVARYTDVFQILRNIESEYNLIKPALLNPNHS